MKAHRAIAEDAHDSCVRLGDLPAESLRYARTQHAQLEGRKERVGLVDLGEEARPHRRVAAVEHVDGVVAENAPARGRYLRAVHGAPRVFQRFVELSSNLGLILREAGGSCAVGLQALIAERRLTQLARKGR
ncbi:MAG: hypothetical protein JRF42_12555 [Deltaproteobacteria bacterium]|nr:hypothetical protein [Deltaproteobacteria bacterium]